MCVCVCVSELVPILLLIYELCVTQNVPNKNQNKQTKHIFFTLSIQMFGLCVCTRVLERACSRLCFILLSSSIVCVMHSIINIDSVFASMYFNCVQFPIQWNRSPKICQQYPHQIDMNSIYMSIFCNGAHMKTHYPRHYFSFHSASCSAFDINLQKMLPSTYYVYKTFHTARDISSRVYCHTFSYHLK